MTSDFIFNLC
jgi:DNA-directed RNA polymerase-3 subunit RPC5